jgi:hypothetical protein
MKRADESPKLIPRPIGGWIALSGAQDAVKIGVLGATEEEARASFRIARAEWSATLEARDRAASVI